MGLSLTMAGVHIHSNRQALVDATADLVTACASAAIAARGRFVWALAGGSTPRDLYATLAAPARRGRIDWTRVHVFWGDERCVPPDDPASNYRMARETLLAHVPVPPAQIHRMRGEDDPVGAAAEYEAQLKGVLGAQADGAPGALDLVLLGLGTDGHTASIFPGGQAGRESSRWVIAELVDPAHGWRLTLTPPVIDAASLVVFLVAGQDKAAVVADVRDGPVVFDELPAQRFAFGGQTVWMLDDEAATQLRKR